jgi:hypothetical protein
MPLDHYVSQVHLKKFCSPVLVAQMHATRKSTLETFPAHPRSVCRIEGGSTNKYLSEPRAIEEFLATIEPLYNAALNKLAGTADDGTDWRDCILAISGFAACAFCCSPAGMRVLVEPLRSLLATTTALMDARGLLPTPPPSMGGSSTTELLRSGKISLNIDPRFAQSIIITSILKHTVRFGNSKWDILHNDWADSPFCTSDFPVCVEETSHPQVINRIIPLSPTLAIRIRPGPDLDNAKLDLSFSNFGYHHHSISRKEAQELNRLIVRCAEDIVFYRDDLPWVRPLIEENRHYRVEMEVQRLGPVHFFSQRVVETAKVHAPR